MAAAVASTLFAAILEFKMSFSLLFYLFILQESKQRTLPLCLKAWLLCKPPRLSSITDLTSPIGLDPTRQGVPSSCTNTHIQTVWNFQGGNLTRHTLLLTTRYIRVCMQCTAHPSIAFCCCLVHSQTCIKNAAEAWLSRNLGDRRQENRTKPSHLFWNRCFFLFKFTKRKGTTEINTLFSARHCGAVSTLCRSNEILRGCKTNGNGWSGASRIIVMEPTKQWLICLQSPKSDVSIIASWVSRVMWQEATIDQPASKSETEGQRLRETEGETQINCRSN